MTAENKNGLIGFVLGIGLAWVVVYIIDRDNNKEELKQPPITDESIRIAVESYGKAITDGQPKENLDEINSQLLGEFGVKVDFKPLENKFVVFDRNNKKVKEVAA